MGENPPFKEIPTQRSYEILHENQPEVFESDIQPESRFSTHHDPMIF